MILEVENDNNVKILDSENFRKIEINNSIIYVDSHIYARVSNDLCIVEYSNEQFDADVTNRPDCIIDILSTVVGAYSLIYIEDNKLVYYGTDLSANKRIYKYIDEPQNRVILFDSLDSFCSIYDNSIELDELEYGYYLKHGYVKGEKTYLKRMFKSMPGVVYDYLRNEEIDLLDVFRCEVDCDYSTFKKILIELVGVICCNDSKVTLLHSGGVDSNLILSLLQNRCNGVELMTYRFEDEYLTDANNADVVRSRRIAEKRHIKHTIVPISFRNYDKYIKSVGICHYMPFECHKTAKAYISLFENSECGNKVFCGQNNDSLYNFGPTELPTFNIFNIKNFTRGLQAICQRKLISPSYIDLLLNNSRFRKKIIDNAISLLWRLRYKERYIAPNTVQELLSYFLNSESYFAMRKQSDKVDVIDDTIDSVDDFYHLLFKKKLRGFVDGNDNKIILKGAEISGRDVYMLYSLQPMIYFYYNMRRNDEDITNPKRYCYQLAREFGLGLKDFKSKYDKKMMKNSDWDDKMKMEFDCNNKKMSFQEVLGEYWAKLVFGEKGGLDEH